MAYGQLTQAETGFEAMMMRHGTTMLRLACVLLGKRQSAEDAVQEALIRLYSKQDRYANQPHERQYVMKAVVNACRDIQRTPWYRRVTPAPLEHAALPAAAGADTSLADAIGKLEPKLREALLVKFYLGFDTDETAGMLGVSPGIVRDRIRRAKARLATVMKESDDDE